MPSVKKPEDCYLRMGNKIYKPGKRPRALFNTYKFINEAKRACRTLSKSGEQIITEKAFGGQKP